MLCTVLGFIGWNTALDEYLLQFTLMKHCCIKLFIKFIVTISFVKIYISNHCVCNNRLTSIFFPSRNLDASSALLPLQLTNNFLKKVKKKIIEVRRQVNLSAIE